MRFFAKLALVTTAALFAIATVVWCATVAWCATGPASASNSPRDAPAGVAPEIVSQIAARLITSAIPRDYERSKDWGRTKRITTGQRSSGNFFDFDIHRRKSEVKHGVWKKYRVTLVDPDKNLTVRIENLRTTAPGRFALALHVTARLQGWARVKIYDRGIHLGAFETEGHSNVRLRLDAEIAIESVASKSYLPGLAVRPVVTAAHLDLDDFRLKRISDLRGDLAREIGDALRHLIEDELAGPKLVARLNRSIEKRRERLELTPETLLGKRE